MNTKTFFVAFIALGIAGAIAIAGPQDTKAADEAAIKAIPMQMQEGWNKGSGTDFAAPFAENADYVVVNGMHIKGRAEIAKGHDQIFSTIYKGSHNEGTVESIRFLRPDVAVVHVGWKLKFKTPGGDQEAKARTSLVVVKNDGKWAIESFQNTPIQNFGPG